MPAITNEVVYLLLIFALLVIPRALQRFRIPAPLTSFGFGIIAAVFLASFSQDATLALLSTLGISSLFLFAGLEVRLSELRRAMWPLVTHLIARAITLGSTTLLAMHYLDMSVQVSALIALALLTPSTGFILDTLERLGLSDDERYWVTVKAVGAELLALLVLFVVMQSGSVAQLSVASIALVLMIAGLPLLFIALGRVVLPHASGSEFSLLVMVGLIAAYITYQLGVYYLVGAFLAGLIARLLRKRMPVLTSDENLRAVQMFASFFVPFYFFYQGMGVPAGAFSWEALLWGLGLSAVFLPMRIGANWVHRRFTAGGTAKGSLRVATALTPTLVFTLVLATILRDHFHVSDTIYGALLIYTGISTILPSLLLASPVDFTVSVGPMPRASDAPMPASTDAPAAHADGDSHAANHTRSVGQTSPTAG